MVLHCSGQTDASNQSQAQAQPDSTASDPSVGVNQTTASRQQDRTSSKKPPPVDDKLRERARERLLKALRGNPHVKDLPEQHQTELVRESEQQACDASTVR